MLLRCEWQTIQGGGCTDIGTAVDPSGFIESSDVMVFTYEHDLPILLDSPCPEVELKVTAPHKWLEAQYDVAPATLHNDHARCYAPTPGRWLSQDPMGFKAGDTNLYRYCIPAKGRFLPEE